MDSTIIDGGGVGKVIDNSDDTSHPIEISNLTIQNGYTTGKGGGISLKMTGDITLKNIRVNNNQANFGGGIHIEGEGSVSFVQTVVYIENSYTCTHFGRFFVFNSHANFWRAIFLTPQARQHTAWRGSAELLSRTLFEL